MHIKYVGEEKRGKRAGDDEEKRREERGKEEMRRVGERRKSGRERAEGKNGGTERQKMRHVHFSLFPQ